MRRAFPRSLFIFALVAVGLICLPEAVTRGWRSFAIKKASPCYLSAMKFKCALFDFSRLFQKEELQAEAIEKAQLIQENQLLRQQVEQLRSYLFLEKHLIELAEGIRSFCAKGQEDPSLKDYFARRADRMRQLLSMQALALPAQVIYREPATWSSSLWLGVGEKDNRALGRTIVARNSPVVIGMALVGVVEVVEENRSRVRLISDSGLVSSVRAVRLEGGGKELHLAKGEIAGKGGAESLLHGRGFNYDFPDEEGPARDLITGLPEDGAQETTIRSLIAKGDLLITSGFDGVFPAGLRLGRVSRVIPLREGGCSYEIEATPQIDPLSDLKTVFILPALTK